MAYGSLFFAFWVGIGVATSSTAVFGQVRLVDYASIRPDAAAITFSEVRVGTSSPVVYTASNTVRFGSLFAGQVVGRSDNTLSNSQPNGPLRLDPFGPRVATAIDLAVRSIVLGGVEVVGGSMRYFATPIAVMFDRSVRALGFQAGDFDRAKSFTIEAFGQHGNSLGKVYNENSGTSRIGVTSDGEAIAGVSLYLEDGMDWEGAAIDDLVFQVPTGEVPEPSSVLVWLGVGSVGYFSYHIGRRKLNRR